MPRLALAPYVRRWSATAVSIGATKSPFMRAIANLATRPFTQTPACCSVSVNIRNANLGIRMVRSSTWSHDRSFPMRRIDWTPVWSFGARALRYLPTAYLYYGYPTKGGEPTCWADSNGNAAGNTLEEAVVQGFLELVERDAVAIWWYNRLPRPGVDLASFEIPYIGQSIDFYARHGRQLWALDLTTDFGIPTFVAVEFGGSSSLLRRSFSVSARISTPPWL